VAVTLINIFTVDAASVDAYLENWRLTTDVFKTGVGNQTFQFVNIARWTSAEAWKATHDDYKPTEYLVPGVKGHPAIFETLINVYSDSLAADDRVEHWIASPPPPGF
jgi:hypothetical protein